MQGCLPFVQHKASLALGICSNHVITWVISATGEVALKGQIENQPTLLPHRVGIERELLYSIESKATKVSLSHWKVKEPVPLYKRNFDFPPFFCFKRYINLSRENNMVFYPSVIIIVSMMRGKRYSPSPIIVLSIYLALEFKQGSKI